MRIKIIDLNLFGKTNGMHNIESVELFDCFKEVYAFYFDKKDTWYLMDILNNGNPNWFLFNESMEVCDNTIPSGWVYIKKYEYYIPPYNSGIKLSNILSPKWMAENKTFFYETFEDGDSARQKFYDNEIKPHRLEAQKDEEEM
ncbi:MAG: hypothetical protein PHR96_03085 [Clostridia bacterium]|nr:hypothetical protein [Clostridia bacterium]